jgi:hypothetical protein
MGVSVKGSIPLVLWLVVFWLVKWLNVEYTGFFGGILIGLGWFLLIPILLESEVSKSAVQWFQKAGLLAVFSAAFGLVGLTLLKNGLWWTWIADFGLLASGFFAVIGTLAGFFRWN